MFKKKYELIPSNKNGLYRIKAIRDFGNIKTGDIGGYIESEENLSHNGDAWVCDDAKVYGDAWVCGDAKVYDDAKVFGNAKVYGDAKVCGDADYIVFKNWWSSGRYFTWTRSNNKWAVGCFYGTGEELIAKAYKDSEKSGKEYERIVRYVEKILKETINEKN